MSTCGGCLVPGGLPDRGVSGPGGAWPQGGLLLGGVPGPGGCLIPEGLVSQHALRHTPPGETAIAADGTHPTGMHSCLRNEGTDERQTALQI